MLNLLGYFKFGLFQVGQAALEGYSKEVCGNDIIPVTPVSTACNGEEYRFNGTS